MTGEQKAATTLPVYAGAVNLAPVEPLIKLLDQPKSRPEHYLCDAIRERYQHFTSLDRAVRNEMLNVWMTIENFMQGKQFAIPDYLNGGWRTVTAPQRDDGKALRPRALNLVSFYRTVFSSRWMSSNPDVQVDAADDDEDAMEAAKAAGTKVDHYEELFFTPWFNWQEGSQALSSGTYITRIRHDAGVQGVMGLRKLYGEKTVVAPGEGDCPDCRYRGEDTEFVDPQSDPQDPLGRRCPACGSPNVLLRPPQEIPIQTLEGTEQINLGELRLDQLPFAACWWDLSQKPEDSSWFIYNQRVSLGQVGMILQGARVPEARSEDRGLQILEGISRSGQALSGYSRFGRRGQEQGMWAQQCTLNEMWLSPADCAEIVCRGDEQTVSGTPLPQGTQLAELFRDGGVAVGLNDFQAVIGLYAGEQHGPSLASGVYDIRSHSGAGRGAADVVDTQQRINKLHSQFERTADAPSYAYLADALNPEDARELTKPNKAIPFDLSGFPEVKRLQDAVLPIQQTAFAPQFMQYAFEHLHNMLQLQFRTVDFSGGLPSVDNKTATGAQIAASLANGLFLPMASIKAEVRKRNARQILEWCQKYFPVQRQYLSKGRNGKSQSVMLGQIDLSRLRLKVVENSQLPQNDVIRQLRTSEYLTLWGGVANYLMARKADPQTVAAFDRIYDFRLEGAEQADEARKVVNRRIRQLQQLVPVIGDPFAALDEMWPPVQMGEPEHTQKALICSAWLDTDEGLDAKLPLRIAVELLGRTHVEMEAQRMALMAGVEGQIAGLSQPPQQAEPGGQQKPGQPGQKQPRPQPQQRMAA